MVFNLTSIAALFLLTPYVPDAGYALAWGVTAVNADVIDIYADTLSADLKRVRTHSTTGQAGWAKVETKPFDMRYRLFGNVAIPVLPFMNARRYTPHGPVLVWDTKKKIAYSARWTALEDDRITLERVDQPSCTPGDRQIGRHGNAQFVCGMDDAGGGVVVAVARLQRRGMESVDRGAVETWIANGGVIVVSSTAVGGGGGGVYTGNVLTVTGAGSALTNTGTGGGIGALRLGDTGTEVGNRVVISAGGMIVNAAAAAEDESTSGHAPVASCVPLSSPSSTSRSVREDCSPRSMSSSAESCRHWTSSSRSGTASRSALSPR